MAEQIKLDPAKVIASLSRQVAEQAQRIAVLEAMIEQSSNQPDDNVSSDNG